MDSKVMRMMDRIVDSRRWAGPLALSIVLAWPTLLHAAEPRNVAPLQVLAELDALLATNTSATLPGCVLGIHGNGIDVTRAYGLADLERPVHNSVDSVFNIASASKQFTAAAVLVLAADGQLQLDDDISKYLPELSGLKQGITIDHLLNHTSGLRDFRFTDWMLGRDTLAQSNTDVLAYAARQKALNHFPGESHLYSNTGYVLLAVIVERVSGRSFQEFTRERLFQPAGMTNTRWETDSQRLVNGRSSGYAVAEWSEDGKPTRFAQMPTARNTFGHGNLLTTIGDMQQWNAALARNAFGGRVTAQLEEPGRLRNGVVLAYARGEFIGKYRGLREVQHGGYNGNYTAWIGRFPGIGLSVSMLCNSDNDDVHPYDVVDLFLPNSAPAREAGSRSTAGPTTDLSMHSGVYRRTDNGQLTLLTFPGKARMTGSHYVLGPDTYEFDPGRPGRVLRRSYGNSAEWMRLLEWKPSPTALDEFEGRFTSDELLGSFEVTLGGEQLKLSVLGLSDITASLEARAPDVFEARGVPNLDGLLVAFKRNDSGRISGLAIAPDSLHELPFRKMPSN